MFDEAISLISLCSSMNSWLTPTVLFVLLNLMIGTIAFTSTFSHKSVHTSSSRQHQQHYHHHFQQQHQQHQFQQPQLITRSSSVLQRLKSINLNNLYSTFYSHPPSTHFHQPEPEPEPEPQQQTYTKEDTVNNDSDSDNDNPSMEEIYNRIKQSNLLSQYNRQNSDTKPSGGEIPVKLPKKMKKSASHKSAFNHFHLQPSAEEVVISNNVETVEEEEVEVEEESRESGVDAQADDFINKFKKKLQLERIHSIVRYKEMISRTSAKC